MSYNAILGDGVARVNEKTKSIFALSAKVGPFLFLIRMPVTRTEEFPGAGCTWSPRNKESGLYLQPAQ